MNHNYIRPGGVAADLPDGWRDDVNAICDTVLKRMDEYDNLLTGQPAAAKPHGRGRRPRRRHCRGARPDRAAAALDREWPTTSAGTSPTCTTTRCDFDVIVGTVGDCWDRFAIRVNEIRESVRILRQVAKAMPDGDYRAQDKKVTPPPRNRIDESMEALIHHFKLFTEGFRVAPGDAYVPVESPRGELGCYIVSDGTSRPYRLHVRAPSFANLQALAPMVRGGFIPDVIACISSIDPVLGDVDR